jgi:hypothetical protein
VIRTLAMILWRARLVFAKVLEQAEADATAKTPGYDEPRATAAGRSFIQANAAFGFPDICLAELRNTSGHFPKNCVPQ